MCCIAKCCNCHAHSIGCGYGWCGMAGIGLCACACVGVEVGKMAKDIGMTIRKGIVVPFLPCLVAFWGFHPYMFFHFFKCFFVTCFCCFLWGGERYEWCLDGLVVWGR